jgi:hypothetical protein
MKTPSTYRFHHFAKLNRVDDVENVKPGDLVYVEDLIASRDWAGPYIVIAVIDADELDEYATFSDHSKYIKLLTDREDLHLISWGIA